MYAEIALLENLALVKVLEQKMLAVSPAHPVDLPAWTAVPVFPPANYARQGSILSRMLLNVSIVMWGSIPIRQASQNALKSRPALIPLVVTIILHATVPCPAL